MRTAIEIRVTPREYADLMVTALEGGSAYWLDSIEIVKGTLPPTVSLRRPWYDTLALYECSSVVYQLEFDDGESEKQIMNHHLRNALELIANNHPNLFADWIRNRVADAHIADTWLQLAVFEEVVYG